MFSQQRLAAPARLSHVPAGDRGTHAHVLRYRPAPESHIPWQSGLKGLLLLWSISHKL